MQSPLRPDPLPLGLAEEITPRREFLQHGAVSDGRDAAEIGGPFKFLLMTPCSAT